MRNAVEALSGHVGMLEADGDPVPSPRDFDAIMNDPDLAEDREGAMTTVVALVRDRGSSTRINVSLDLGLLEAIDAAVRERGQTRSAFSHQQPDGKSSNKNRLPRLTTQPR